MVSALICVDGVSVLLSVSMVVNPVAADNIVCGETTDVVKDIGFFNGVVLDFVVTDALCVLTDCIICDGVVVDCVTIGALISAGTVVGLSDIVATDIVVGVCISV